MGSEPLTKSQATRIRLIDAAEHLYVTQPVTEVTTRAIAEQASCSTGLAYRYFDSKDALMGAVLDRAAAYITQDMEPTDPPPVLAQKAWQRMQDKPVFARLTAHLLMENRTLGEIVSGFPFLQLAIGQALAADDDDPETAAASLATLVLGHAFFAPIINSAIDRPPDDPRIYDRMQQATNAIYQSEPRP